MNENCRQDNYADIKKKKKHKNDKTKQIYFQLNTKIKTNLKY